MITYRTATDADFGQIVDFVFELQTHIVALDPLERLIVNRELLVDYIQKLMAKVAAHGAAFIAEEDGVPVGMIVGVIEPQDPDELAWTIPTKHGEVEELYVDLKVRGQGVATKLLDMLEQYFIDEGCDAVVLSVFRGNQTAHSMYLKRGYHDRTQRMLKVLKRG